MAFLPIVHVKTLAFYIKISNFSAYPRKFLSRSLFLSVKICKNRLVCCVLTHIHHKIQRELLRQLFNQHFHKFLLFALMILICYLFELIRHDLERFFSMHDLNGKVLEYVFKVRSEFLRLPVSELGIRVFVVPDNHRLLFFYEGSICLLSVALHDILNWFNPAAIKCEN